MNCKHYQREIEHFDSVHIMSANVAKHIETCADCSGFKREHDSLHKLIGNLERVAAPANFDAKLRARLYQSKAHQQGVFTWLNLSLLRPAIGVGFALVLLVFGLVFVRPMFIDDGKTLGEVAVKGFQAQKIKPVVDEVKKPNPQQTPVLETVAGTVETTHQKKQVLIRNKPKEERFVNDSSVRGGEGIPVFPVDSFAINSETILVPLRSSTSSPYIILNDKKVPVRSVSFGSPTFLDGRKRQVTYSSDAEGIW